MLGIAIYNDKINYIRSERDRKGLRVTHHGTLKYDNFNNIINCSIRDILTKEKIENENKISFVVDSQFCVFNEIFCEDEKNLEFHNNLSGSLNLSEHLDSYYYPINSRDDHFLGIHIDKGIKQRLLNAIKENECKPQVIGIGIFSSEMLARYVFNAKTLDNYLILRFISTNLIEVLYIDDGILNVYGQYKILNQRVIPIKVFGNIINAKKVKECITKVVIRGHSRFSKIEKIFLYQTQGQSKVIKNLIKAKKSKSNLKLLNLFDYDMDSNYSATFSNSIKHVSYAELGQIFGGLNV